MPREQFTTKNFNRRSLATIDTANLIIDEYQGQGIQLTLRQLYYQFVARDLIENSERSYRRLGNIISDGRLAGLIDWYAIEDRTRFLRGITPEEDMNEIMSRLSYMYIADKWADQDAHLEVWIEKDALLSVIETVCNRYQVDYFACRGYASQSELWRAGKRLERRAGEGKKVIVLHLGDHDPSGIDMTRDNRDRIEQFSWNAGVEVKRLALNFDQVEEHNPPPNPAKISDSRAMNYIARHGTSSWELDALDPTVIRDLIENEITQYIDYDNWDDAAQRQDNMRAKLSAVADRWDDIERYLEDL